MSYIVTVTCDKCNNGFCWTNESIGKSYAISLARKRGWSVGKKWLCPYCNYKKKKSEECSERLVE